MDETYIRVKGEWKYLYRAVDKYGKTIDFLLTDKRDEQAAKTFLARAIRRHGGVPEKITIDGSAANEAAIKSYSQPYTIFLLNDDMELNRYRKTFIQKMLKELQA